MSKHKTSEYYSWTNMKTRCYNINNEAYETFYNKYVETKGEEPWQKI